MGHLDIAGLRYRLPDGRLLLDSVSFRVGEGQKVALVGANGCGKTTLLRVVAGDEPAHGGAVTGSGGIGVMRQFIGSVRDASTVLDLLVSLSVPRVRSAAEAVRWAEDRMAERDDEPAQLAYAAALAEWGEAGGYEVEVLWDVCCTAAMGEPLDKVRQRPIRTLSGGEQKRLALEALLRGPEQVLLLDEPDNYLDVPAKRALEERLAASDKTVLFVSHDRTLLARTATRVVTLELQAGGNIAWEHPRGYASYRQARSDRVAKLVEHRKRWDEEHAKLRALVELRKEGGGKPYQAAQTRLARFEAAGPPQEIPREQRVSMRLSGGRTAKRAVRCSGLELVGLTEPFDLELWYGERVAVLGGNGTGKSHFLRLLAAGETDPEPEHRPIGELTIEPVVHEGRAVLGSRVRPGWFAQTHEHPELYGRTLQEILHRGDEYRDGMPRDAAARVLDRYELAQAADQPFETLSGGQQARLQILLLELAGATLLLLDEPTDNLDTVSADALEAGLAEFSGTVLAVTHDRWFADGFDRYCVFGADGTVTESTEPIWDR